MIVAGQRLPIRIATKPVDFRCGHQALALMVETVLKLDPHSGVKVVFHSKRGDRLKILVWDGIWPRRSAPGAIWLTLGLQLGPMSAQVDQNQAPEGFAHRGRGALANRRPIQS